MAEPDISAHAARDALYAEQLIESLSDVVDVLNEALLDGLVYNFNIGQVAGPEGKPKWALTSLTATKAIPIGLPDAP